MIESGFKYNSTPPDFNPGTDLPQGFMDFALTLHRKLAARQRDLIAERVRVLASAHVGDTPNHLAPSDATTGKNIRSLSTFQNQSWLRKDCGGEIFFAIEELQRPQGHIKCMAPGRVSSACLPD